MNTKKIKFKLTKISTDQFAIIPDAFKSETEITLNVGFRFGFNFREQILAVYALVQFEQDQSPFLIAESGCHFELEKSFWYADAQSDKTINVEREFALHLAAISIGVVRGVLHAKTEGTPFSHFILPTINVGDILKNDIKISKT